MDLPMIPSVQGSAPQSPTPKIDAPTLAAQLLARHAKGATHDIAALRREVEALKAQDPKLGAEVERLVKAGLPAVEQVRFEGQATKIRAPDGSTLTIKQNAPTVADYRAMKPGSEGRAFYDRLDTMFGDGNPKTDDSAKINAAINRALAGGLSLEQAAALAKREAANEPGTDWGKLGLDVTQMALDVVGIFEPTPFADGANTIISIGRGDGWGALASAAGILPYVGDLAKLGKLGKWAKTIGEAVELVTHNPAARKALEPALRKLYDALKAIPDGALKKLPQDAQDVLAGITKQLDGLFARALTATERVAQKYPLLAKAEKVEVKTAAQANEAFVAKGWQPPYAAGTDVAEFVTKEPMQFVRVHGPDNKARSWMMEASSIEGLSAAQIKEKFALPDLPTFVSDVHVPAGTSVRVGEVAPQAGWGAGGATQYELLQRLPEAAFQNTRGLK